MKWLNKSLLVICVALILCVIAVFIWFATLDNRPKPVDGEAQRKRNSKRCKELQCINKWLKEHGTDGKDLVGLFESCYHKRSYQLSYINYTYPLYQKGDIDMSFYKTFFQYRLYTGCHKECDVSVPFRIYSHQCEYDVMFAKKKVNNIKMFCRNYPDEKSCRFSGMLTVFVTYFPYFSIPATVVLAIVDLSILRQALKGIGLVNFLCFQIIISILSLES